MRGTRWGDEGVIWGETGVPAQFHLGNDMEIAAANSHRAGPGPQLLEIQGYANRAERIRTSDLLTPRYENMWSSNQRYLVVVWGNHFLHLHLPYKMPC